MVGKTEGNERRGQQRMRWLDSISGSIYMNLSKLWEIVKDREAWHAAVHGVAKLWSLENMCYILTVVKDRKFLKGKH